MFETETFSLFCLLNSISCKLDFHFYVASGEKQYCIRFCTQTFFTILKRIRFAKRNAKLCCDSLNIIAISAFYYFAVQSCCMSMASIYTIEPTFIWYLNPNKLKKKKITILLNPRLVLNKSQPTFIGVIQYNWIPLRT